MNSVNIAGRITEEPLQSVSSSGLNIARFKIAVDKTNKDSNGNTYDIFEVVVFKDLANLDLKLGQFVGITGKLTANNYEKDGKAYYNCSIVGNVVSLLGK